MELKPIVLEEIREYAREFNVRKVILFGSRARGDQKEKSDIVNLDASVQEELRKSIDEEGIVLYEKI